MCSASLPMEAGLILQCVIVVIILISIEILHGIYGFIWIFRRNFSDKYIPVIILSYQMTPAILKKHLVYEHVYYYIKVTSTRLNTGMLILLHRLTNRNWQPTGLCTPYKVNFLILTITRD